MKMRFLLPLSILSCLFLLLVDGLVATLVSNYLPGSFTSSSYLLFIFGLYLTRYMKWTVALVLYGILGLLYDLYYIGIVGIAVTLFPLAILLVYYFSQELNRHRILTPLMLVIIVFMIEWTGFICAHLFQVTDLEMNIYLIFHLVPSLLFNLLLFFSLVPLLNRLFGITNKK